MGIEGRLNIRLKVGKGAVEAVDIESSRPVHASRVFNGKSVAESQRLLPMLFSVCATAQVCAGARACEQALGLRASPRTEGLRDALVNMETLREHLWRILLDWPSLTGAAADESGMAELVAMQQDYRRALCADAAPFRLGGADCRADLEALASGLDRLAGLLRRRVFAMPHDEWLALTGQDALIAWAAAGQTVAARLIDRVLRDGWAHAGACESSALPALQGQELHRAMQDAAYVERPRWHGQCRETSSLTRVDSPLLEALKREYGNGLLVRLAARLTEIARLAGGWRPDAGGASGEGSAGLDPVNPGIGQAAAARGLLVHRVELTGEVIGSYQILAPTEWNFHPEGVVARALSALKGDAVSMERQARLLIGAIDPCVGYELNIVPKWSPNA